MKYLLSGVIGAILSAIAMLWLWPGADCHEERATITALSQRNDAAQLELGQVRHELRNHLERQAAQWEAKQAAHRLAKTQRELGAQLALKVGKIDDLYSIPQPKMSKIDTEVESITALARTLTPMEAKVKQEAAANHEFIPAAFRSYYGKVLQYGLTRGK